MRAMSLTGRLIGLLAAVGLASAASAGPPPGGVFVGFDFNADGKGDIARSSASQILVNHLDGASSVGTGTFPTGGGVLALKAVGLCNGDDNADPVAQGGGSARVSFTNAGGTGQASALFIPDGGGSWQVVDAADTNGDGVDEVIFNGNGAVRVTDIQSGVPAYSYVPTAGNIWVYLFAADVNGDGDQDLVFNGTGSAAGIARANLSGGATQVFFPLGGGVWQLDGAGDLNDDGTADLVQTGVGGTAVGFNRVVLLNTSAAPITSGFPPNGGGAFQVRTVSDFNGDGKVDIGYQGPSPSNRITLMNGITPTGNVSVANAGGTVELRGAGDTQANGKFGIFSVFTGSNDVRVQTPNAAGNAIAATGQLPASGNLFVPTNPAN